MYKILLVDNEEIFVTTLQTIFNSLPDYEVIGVLPNVDNLEAECVKCKPDIVVTRTFFFLKKTAFQAVENLKKEHREIKVIMMLDMAKQAHIEEAKRVVELINRF